MTTVLIADDHAAIRAGLRMVLEHADGIEVVGEAADGAVAIRNARALRPDVVLMDVRMPGTDGIEATRELAAAGMAVLVLTSYDGDEAVFGAIRAGAAGFLLKTVEAGDLIEAVRRVAQGEGAIAPSVARRILAAVAGSEVGPSSADGHRDGAPRGGLGAEAAARVASAGLTERELELLGEIGRGASNGAIARRLGITVGTTKSHVSSILAKLGLESRTQAALVARDAGVA
ncbi:DNA-binding response regulator [Pseudoclavibacter endophyticus]|uniref:Response regulator transcription factor n=1 Tax=Pseudoclavibacter endophyticus TaxID=1778590 RepID=A0A6H9WLG3_9MICO|nr:response regulator transcription factor [Pseudoclavibacter endophyticus]KAB1646752.1 response regulator transcription factor [Pseudoclavibacter endophyticus]GGA75875.1 DNA-binding response regulator [Pseudoclavibacter endophyticus]